MTETEFNQTVDTILLNIEAALDAGTGRIADVNPLDQVPSIFPPGISKRLTAPSRWHISSDLLSGVQATDAWSNRRSLLVNSDRPVAGSTTWAIPSA